MVLNLIFTPSRVARKAILIDCALIVGAGALLALLLRPFQNAPFIDDFCFAWSVEHLLKTGEFRLLEYTNNPNPIQVVWGALFCLPAGFSFTALRISTFVAAMMGLCGIYLLLIALGRSRRDALVGTGVVGLNPMWFILQFSFMSDVLFIAITIFAILAFARGLARRNTMAVVLSAILASLAIGVRTPGVVFPGAAVVVLLIRGGAWGRNWRRLIPWIFPALMLAGAMAWQKYCTVKTADLTWIDNSPAQRLAAFKEYGVSLLPEMIPIALTTAIAVLGMSLVPLAFGCLDRRSLRIAALALAAIGVLIWLEKGGTHALESGSTWVWCEIGAVHLPNRPRQLPPGWLDMALRIIAALSSAAVIGCALARVRGQTPQDRQSESGSPVRSPNDVDGAQPFSERVQFTNVATWLCTLLLAGQFLLISLFWLFYDRFYLPLIPLLVILILARRPIVRPAIALNILAIFLAISFLGTHDHLATSRAMWRAMHWLENRGARPAEIDGGYAISGWLQYAHPENAPRNKAGEIVVPSFTTDMDEFVPRYQLSDSPQAGAKVLAQFPYRRWMARSGIVYVLEYEHYRVPGS